MFNLTKVGEFRLKLYPKDFAKARAFYEEILGYPVIKEWNRADDDLGIMFDVGGKIIELLSPEDEYLPVQNVDLSLEVQDVHRLHETLLGKVDIVRDLGHNDWGDTSFTIVDPDGLEITFFTKD